MGKTGFRGHYYLLAGGAGAVVGFSYNAMSRNALVEYANGILSRFISDETILAILRRITPSLYGCALAMAILGISRRVRAHMVRALLSYDGWFLRGKKVNRKLVMLWGLSLTGLLGRKTRPIGGYQDFLPKYPLPPLDQTLDRYLESMKPVLSAEEYQRVSESVEDFRLKDGPKLHRYLWLEHFKSRNWVADPWLEYVYLRYRGPLPINSNYFTVDCREVPTPHQLDRAAGYTHQLLMFIQRIDRGWGIKNIISQGIVPFDSHFYDHSVRGVRIPGEECDTLQRHTGSTHIIVLRNGKYFRVEVVDKKGRVISARQLKEKLQYVLNLAGEDDDERYIAALTAQDRPTWAKQRKALEADPTNKHILQSIDTALVFLSIEREPVADLTDLAQKSFHGNGRNTWFDKACSFVFYTDGHHTGNVEHSYMDATVHEHMMEWTFFGEQYDEAGRVVDSGEPDLELDVPRQMHWNFDGCEHFLEKAQDHYLKLIGDSDLRMSQCEYGKRLPKQCKVSPDGWCQMAFQLAWYRLYKIPVLTYEAATTRMFYQGRTETIRPTSEYSNQFVKAFDDSTVSTEEKKQLLKKAIGVQERNKFLAMRGQGADRHLFGLYLMAKHLKLDPFPSFLNGNAFAFRLSTSQTPTRQTNDWSEERCGQGGGFGTVMEDGYGVSYMFIGEDRLNVSVHSKKSHPFTDTDTFHDAIHKALADMKDVFLATS